MLKRKLLKSKILAKNRLYFYFGRQSQTNPQAAVTRSLYVALVFAAFFALMLFLQMVNVSPGDQGTFSPYVVDDEDEVENKSGGVSGRFRLIGTEEKEMVLPPQAAERVKQIIADAKYNADNLIKSKAWTLTMTPSDNVSLTLAINISKIYNTYLKDRWQKVPGAKEKFFVFAAYFDDRLNSGRVIRVIAATRTAFPQKVKCRLWYSSTYAPTVVPASNKRIKENWNLKYSAYFVLCNLGKNPVPDAVSIMTASLNATNRKGNYLLVHNHPNLRKRLELNDFAVCVKPLHYHFNDEQKMAEFVEFNRLLGVSHVIFYNHSIGPRVNCLLKEYIKQNMVTMLPWELDIKSQKEIRTEGLFAALNDCLYRTMYRFKYVLMIDLDEFIVPHMNTSLKELMTSLSAPRFHPERTGAYSFQNAFFYLQWDDDVQYSGHRLTYNFTTLRKTRRKSQLHRHKVRSKLIVRPERVVEVGNHFVWEHVRGSVSLSVPPTWGFLHHYRICEFGGNDCVKQPSVVDRRVYSWKDSLVNSVDLSMRNFSIKCIN